MLMPWRLVSERHRAQVIDLLPSFEALALVYPGQEEVSPTERHFSTEMRQETIERIRAETDPQRDIWIASDGSRGGLYSLLHANVSSAEEAQVDLLCAAAWGYQEQTATYEGFGEFVLLTMTLEKMGISRFHIPLALDAKRAGIASSGWREQEPGVYIHTQ